MQWGLIFHHFLYAGTVSSYHLFQIIILLSIHFTVYKYEGLSGDSRIEMAKCCRACYRCTIGRYWRWTTQQSLQHSIRNNSYTTQNGIYRTQVIAHREPSAVVEGFCREYYWTTSAIKISDSTTISHPQIMVIQTAGDIGQWQEHAFNRQPRRHYWAIQARRGARDVTRFSRSYLEITRQQDGNSPRSCFWIFKLWEKRSNHLPIQIPM